MSNSMLAKTTLFVVIPNEQLRKNIVAGLSSFYLCVEFNNIASVINVLEEQSSDLILCHHSLVEEQQTVVLSALKEKSAASKILIYGPRKPIETQISALKHGARGYFNEILPIEKLAEALNLVLNGEVWVERHVISGLIDEIVKVPTISEAQRVALNTLTPKEMEVAQKVSYGATNKMIAKTMNITDRTVKAHLTTIFQKMEIPDRLSLAIFFRDLR
jgi:two-component system, NarL family, nitrate/nitrite response regulator NarL